MSRGFDQSAARSLPCSFCAVNGLTTPASTVLRWELVDGYLRRMPDGCDGYLLCLPCASEVLAYDVEPVASRIARRERGEVVE